MTNCLEANFKGLYFTSGTWGNAQIDFMAFPFLEGFRCQIKAILWLLLKVIGTVYQAPTRSQALCEVVCTHLLHFILTASLWDAAITVSPIYARGDLKFFRLSHLPTSGHLTAKYYNWDSDPGVFDAKPQSLTHEGPKVSMCVQSELPWTSLHHS